MGVRRDFQGIVCRRDHGGGGNAARGFAHGASEGWRIAGPVGAVVGAPVGGVIGGVEGLLGIQPAYQTYQEPPPRVYRTRGSAKKARRQANRQRVVR
jgi:hypothetical protein